MVLLLSQQSTRFTVWPNLSVSSLTVLLSRCPLATQSLSLFSECALPSLLTVCSCYSQCLECPPSPFPQCLCLGLGLNENIISSRKFWPRIRTDGMESPTGRSTNMFCFHEGVIKNVNLNSQDEAFTLAVCHGPLFPLSYSLTLWDPYFKL